MRFGIRHHGDATVAANVTLPNGSALPVCVRKCDGCEVRHVTASCLMQVDFLKSRQLELENQAKHGTIQLEERSAEDDSAVKAAEQEARLQAAACC